jgi:hypothetical protein
VHPHIVLELHLLIGREVVRTWVWRRRNNPSIGRHRCRFALPATLAASIRRVDIQLAQGRAANRVAELRHSCTEGFDLASWPRIDASCDKRCLDRGVGDVEPHLRSDRIAEPRDRVQQLALGRLFVDRVQQAGRGYVATLPAREHNIQGLVRDPNNQSARPPAANPLQGDIRCRGKRAGGLRGRFGAWEGAAHLLGGGVGAVYVLESSALPEVDLVRRRMLPVPELRATATPSCLVGHCSPPFLTARGLGRQRHRGGGCHHQELQCSNADLLFTADPYDLGSSTKLCTLNTYI